MEMEPLDIVLALEGKANLILYNNGSGQFHKTSVLMPYHPLLNPKLTGEDSEDVALVDFDNDGDLDLFFASEDTDHHELFWNEGNDQFKPASFDFEKKHPANALTIVDFQ